MRTVPKYQIDIESSDILDTACDVLILKYAQALYGADRAVAARIAGDNAWNIEPEPGDFELLPSMGRTAAKQLLFVGTVSIYDFDYGAVRELTSRAMQIIATNVPSARRIAMTIHGVGFGLDETECFLALIAGLQEAARSNNTPPFLQRVTIVERNQSRALRLKQLLKEYLPQSTLAERSSEEFSVQQARISAAGLGSGAKPHVFVAMPFSDEMEDTYFFGIQSPVNAAGYLCERVDFTSFTGDILAQIKKRIESASLVIADLTGANANVYLEVGYAWGRDRPTVLIAKKGFELKFDVQSQKCLFYRNISHLAKTLEAELADMNKPA